MSTCNCMGPQNGQPLCPCQMRAVQGWRGAEEWRPYATAALPTQQSARKLLPEAPETDRDLIETVIACTNGQIGIDAAREIVEDLGRAGFVITRLQPQPIK